MQEPETEKLELQQPLEILRSTARRLMDRQIPASSTRLDEFYAHIKGAVADSIDNVNSYINRSLTLAGDHLTEDLDEETRHHAQVTMDEIQTELTEALEQVKHTFFSASSFQECEARLVNLALFESRLEGSLLRLEQVVAMVDDPELLAPPAYIPAPVISDILEVLGESLEQIQLHLRDGSKEPLHLALGLIKQAQAGLNTALNQ